MFHRAGSDLVASGIPFTHAIRRNVKGDWEDTSNDDAPTRFGPGSIGIGGCRNSVPSKTTVSEADPLRLSALKLLWDDGHDSQVLNPATPPAAENAQIPTMFPSTLFSLAPFTANPKNRRGRPRDEGVSKLAQGENQSSEL